MQRTNVTGWAGGRAELYFKGVEVLIRTTYLEEIKIQYIFLSQPEIALSRDSRREVASCVELSVRSVVHKVWNLILKYCLAKKTHRGL